jgi:hypothetical protein
LQDGNTKEFTIDQHLDGGIGILSGRDNGTWGRALTNLHYLSPDYLKPGDFFGYDAGNDSVLLAN